MAFRTERAQAGTPRSAPARIEYRLARDSVVREFRMGRLSRVDVCDAHPELLRAARGVGEETVEDCPICADAKVVHVAFAFGPRLPPGGRCLSSGDEIVSLSRGGRQVSCYVVEVCPSCSWNHLARQFVVGGGARSA